MPYDSSLDKQLFTQTWDGEGTTVRVSVYSYNNGPKKIQIGRESSDPEGQTRFAKLGRLTKEELEGILPILQEALKHV